MTGHGPQQHDSSAPLFGIVANPDKEGVSGAVIRLTDILDRRGVKYLLLDELLHAFPELGGRGEVAGREGIRRRASMVIAFGGDGTMLSAGRSLAGTDIPLMGVNLGKLGFLAEFSVNELEETVAEVLKGEYRIVRRTLLQATFPDDPGLEPMTGLNDIVIDKRDGALMLRLDTSINGDFLGSYSADGLILATPTGSTAYSLAVGGPVVIPSARVVVIAPIAPHMLTARPVVVPDESVIEVLPSSHRTDESVRVYADGQITRSLPMGHRLRVTRNPAAVSLVKRISTTYFDVLRAKLLWGREPVLGHPREPAD